MCGIIGIAGKEAIAQMTYQGMMQMQHRGQDAAGILTYDPKTGQLLMYKNHGLVCQVLTSETLPESPATWGIGHIRYATVGKGCVKDTQPLCTQGPHPIAIGHNGNIVSYVKQRNEMEKRGIVFDTACDAEVILHLIAENLTSTSPLFDEICKAILEVYTQTTGAYSVVGIIAGVGMIAFRDPWGIRPLLYGTQTKTNTHAFASETDALTFLDFENIHDILPGEVVFVDMDHNVQRCHLVNHNHSHCSFEFNYFAKNNTLMEKQEIYTVRYRLGEALAQKVVEADFDIDVVVPIPDSARPAAIGLAQALNLPMHEGFVKRDHIGRTFIMPTTAARKKALSHKLAAVNSVFEGKSVILVDDSIVRGTVSQRVVKMAFNAGAKNVYFASTYPPIRHPCVYGIDFFTRSQLIASGRTVEQIGEFLGDDGEIYNDIQDLKKGIGIEGLCTACVTGEYPTSMHGVEELQSLREIHIKEMELTCKA